MGGKAQCSLIPILQSGQLTDRTKGELFRVVLAL